MFKPIVYNWVQGEFQQLPSGEKIGLGAISYVVNYQTPTDVWQIPHGLNLLLPDIPYTLVSNGQIFMAGVNEELSDLQQTTLLLTEPMSGKLYYQLPDENLV